MVVGNDYSRLFGLGFLLEGEGVVVYASEAYLRTVFGGQGQSRELMDCATVHRDELIEIALAHRSEWTPAGEGARAKYEYHVRLDDLRTAKGDDDAHAG